MYACIGISNWCVQCYTKFCVLIMLMDSEQANMIRISLMNRSALSDSFQGTFNEEKKTFILRSNEH